MTKTGVGPSGERLKEGFDDVVGSVRDAVNDGVDSAKERLGEGADEINRRYQKTMSRAQDGAERAADHVGDQLEDAQDALNEGYTRAKKQLSNLHGEVSDYAADNPLSLLLIAAGIGFLAGLIVNHHRD